MTGPAVVLFTRDLRTHDHPALAAAARAHDELVPLFVLDQRLLRRSANRTAFLLDALEDLRASLGGALVVRAGRAEDVVASFRPRAIYATADTGAFGRAREQALGRVAPLHTFPGTSVVEPGAVTPAGADHYRVFTPYWRAWARAVQRPLEEQVRSVRLSDEVDPGTLPSLEELGVGEPSPEVPRGGETEGRRQLASFLERAALLRRGARPPRVRTERRASHRTSASAASRRSRSRRPPLVPTRSCVSSAGATSTSSFARPSRGSGRRTTGLVSGAGAAIRRRSTPGGTAEPGFRSWMPACASSAERGGCTTGRGCSRAPSS